MTRKTRLPTSERLALPLALGALAALALASACQPGPEVPPAEEDLLVPPSPAADASATDLAPAPRFVANVASRIEVDLQDPSEDELGGLVSEIAGSVFATRLFAGQQLAFLVPQIAAHGYRLDLSATRSELDRFEMDGEGRLTLDYHADLALVALGVDAPAPTTVEVLLPLDPWRLQARVGHRCLAEDNADPPPDRYPYTFDPSRPGCEDAMRAAGVAVERLEITLQAAPERAPRWPRYDRMAEDGVVTAVVAVSALAPGWEPGLPDASLREVEIVVAALEAAGFEQRAATDAEAHRLLLVRKIEIEAEVTLEERVLVLGPEAIAAGEERDPEGIDLISHADLLLLGSDGAAEAIVSALEPNPAPAYQAIVLDGAFRYADLSLRLQQHAATDTDPNGTAAVDLVTNISPEVTVGRGQRLALLLFNLLRGAAHGGILGDRAFSWDRIVAHANLRAREAQGRASTHHAIFGTTALDDTGFSPSP